LYVISGAPSRARITVVKTTSVPIVSCNLSPEAKKNAKRSLALISNTGCSVIGKRVAFVAEDMRRTRRACMIWRHRIRARVATPESPRSYWEALASGPHALEQHVSVATRASKP
jgi:hypothetical protein